MYLLEKLLQYAVNGQCWVRQEFVTFNRPVNFFILFGRGGVDLTNTITSLETLQMRHRGRTL